MDDLIFLSATEMAEGARRKKFSALELVEAHLGRIDRLDPRLNAFVTVDGERSKQGNPLLRFLWNEAAMHAVREDPDLKHFYRRKLAQKGMGKAIVAAARKLGIRLWIMLRDQIDYQEFCRRGRERQKSDSAHAGMPARNIGPAVQ